MNIILDRRYPKDTYTIGRFYINGKLECNSLEDKDRGLKSTDSLATIRKIKVPNETAIPKGKYEVLMDVVSPKYAARDYYKKLCGGKMPRLKNVPGFEGILIHPGNTALDTSGCILLGVNSKVGQLTQSRATFERIYKMMKAAHDKGEKIWITIK